MDAIFRREGCRWSDLQDARGVIFVYPLTDGSGFSAWGDASGFHHSYTNIKEYSAGAWGWISNTWDHWPIGWLNSQGHVVDEESLKKYPNHFAPDGMDFYALNYEESERGVYYSLIGVAGDDLEKVRRTARKVVPRWLLWLPLAAMVLSFPEALSLLQASVISSAR